MKTASQKTIESYDKAAAFFGSVHPDRGFYKKEIGRFLTMCEGKKIIDIGCGEGRDAILFVDNGVDCTGIDASAAMIRQARKNAVGAKFIQMDFYDLKFPPRTFDGFWAAASILHAPKRRVRKLLLNIGRIIKDGGVGFISLRGEKSAGEGMVKEQKYGGIDRYFSYYGKKEFEYILKESKFKIIGKNEIKDGRKLWRCYFVKKIQ